MQKGILYLDTLYDLHKCSLDLLLALVICVGYKKSNVILLLLQFITHFFMYHHLSSNHVMKYHILGNYYNIAPFVHKNVMPQVISNAKVWWA